MEVFLCVVRDSDFHGHYRSSGCLQLLEAAQTRRRGCDVFVGAVIFVVLKMIVGEQEATSTSISRKLHTKRKELVPAMKEKSLFLGGLVLSLL